MRQRFGAHQRAMGRIRGRKARQRSVIAPVGGLNTRDALSAMPQEDAWELVNWIPDAGSCRLRPGFTTHSVDMGEVLTVAAFEDGSSSKLLAATATAIFDVSNDQSFIASAVALENTELTSALTITDAKTGALSVYCRPYEVGRVLGHDRFSLDWTGTKFQLTAANASGTTILDIETSALDDSKWYNLLIAWDLAATTAYLYVNNASDLTSTTVTDDTIDYDFADWQVGDTTGNMDLAELWFDDATIDFSVSGNRTDFIDTSGRPVSLGSDGSTPTGSAPLVYLTGARSSFTTHAGTGEDFTGTPADALSSPSQKAVSLDTGFANGRWQHWQFNARLFLANGADTLKVYDGSTLASSTFSGPTLANIIGGTSYKNRVYVWEDQSMSFWYGGVNSISGAMTEFDLSRVGKRGGYLVTMASWTLDGGDGVDDYAVFIMSSGEVIVYKGSDPSDSASWALVGVYYIDSPMGRRSVVKFGGDIVIQAHEDYVRLSEVMRENLKRTKISGAAREASTAYADNDGWQVCSYPKGGWLLFNIPVSGTRFDQHMLNIVTGAWTKFEGINARCFEVYVRDLYFGGIDGVYKADSGLSDNGGQIDANAYQAWNAMGVQGLKRMTAFRPVLQSEGALTYNAALAYDFGSANVAVDVSQASAGTLWGSAWGSPWSAAIQIKQDWSAAAGMGNEVSIRLRVAVINQSVKWFRTDFLFEPGGVL